MPTGAPLIDFDDGTVVGRMPTIGDEELFEPERPSGGGAARGRAVPMARALAKRLGVELAAVTGTGRDGLITLDDVLLRARVPTAPPAMAKLAARGETAPVPLRGPRRAMAHTMSLARDQTALSTVCDDADIQCWKDAGAYTLRVMRAMTRACAAEPALNAWYDPTDNSRVLLKHIDLGVAIDTPGGLLVPVLRNIESKSPEQLDAALRAHRQAAHDRRTSAEDLRDFTLMLTNFGTLAGRYATPQVVPPAVAILGVGRVHRDAVAVGEAIEAHRRLPLSLSFDHRCVTGGEACRFLAAAIADLEMSE